MFYFFLNCKKYFLCADIDQTKGFRIIKQNLKINLINEFFKTDTLFVVREESGKNRALRTLRKSLFKKIFHLTRA